MANGSSSSSSSSSSSLPGSDAISTDAAPDASLNATTGASPIQTYASSDSDNVLKIPIQFALCCAEDPSPERPECRMKWYVDFKTFIQITSTTTSQDLVALLQSSYRNVPEDEIAKGLIDENLQLESKPLVMWTFALCNKHLPSLEADVIERWEEWREIMLNQDWNRFEFVVLAVVYDDVVDFPVEGETFEGFKDYHMWRLTELACLRRYDEGVGNIERGVVRREVTKRKGWSSYRKTEREGTCICM